jgi:hypothetical protein
VPLLTVEGELELVVHILCGLPPIGSGLTIQRGLDFGSCLMARLLLLIPLLIDRGDGLHRGAHGKRAKSRCKILELSENGFAAKFVLNGDVANVTKQLLVDAADGVGQRHHEILFGARIFRKAHQHFFDILGQCGHRFLLAA